MAAAPGVRAAEQERNVDYGGIIPAQVTARMGREQLFWAQLVVQVLNGNICETNKETLRLFITKKWFFRRGEEEPPGRSR